MATRTENGRDGTVASIAMIVATSGPAPKLAAKLRRSVGRLVHQEPLNRTESLGSDKPQNPSSDPETVHKEYELKDDPRSEQCHQKGNKPFGSDTSAGRCPDDADD